MTRNSFKNIETLVVKVGTSSLSYPNGRLNLLRMEALSNTLSSIRHKGIKVVLVSSGAIGVGAGKVGLLEKPTELAKKQALAAVGQAQLIKIYQKLFASNKQDVAQVLLTKDIVTMPDRHDNAKRTLTKLLDMGIIPIINENDTISTDEIEFGDNDTLSALVATIVNADLLVLLSDIDGLYSADPKVDKNALIIKTVSQINKEIESLASGAGSSFGTGGMQTKITASKIATKAGIDTIITNGEKPDILFGILNGEEIGTHFESH